MVNLIIKNGNNFVLNGNELLQTENPVLEVPDILNSEEVREKIAEDVKEGDVLFNYSKGYDYNEDLPTGGDSNQLNFVIYDNEVYLIASMFQKPNLKVFVYRDGKWKTIGGINDHEVADNSYTINTTTKMFSQVIGDSIFNIRAEFRNNQSFNLNKWTGGNWSRLPYGPYLERKNITGSYTGQFQGTGVTRIVEIDGEYHFIVYRVPPDYTSPTSYTGSKLVSYKYTDFSSAPVETNFENSFDFSGIPINIYGCDIFESSGSYYLLATESPYLWKWNSSTQTWEHLKKSQAFTTYDYDHGRTESGDIFKLMYDPGGWRVWKFNPSIEDFEVFAPMPTGTNNSDYYGFFCDGDDLYIKISYSVSYADSSSIYTPTTALYKYNTTTSGWDLDSEFDTYNIYRTLTTSSTAYRDAVGFEIVKHGNKLFAALGGTYDPNLHIYSKDVSGGSWERYNWSVPQGHASNGAFDMDYIEYQGRHLLCFGQANTPHVTEYIPSSNSWLDFRYADVSIGTYAYAAGFFIQDDKLKVYGFSNANPARSYIYEVDFEHRQLFKIADPSGDIPTGRRSESEESIILSLSGNEAYGLFTTNDPLEFYKITESEWTQLSIPSGVTGANGNLRAIVYDNKIWLCITEREEIIGTADTNPGLYSYDPTTSSWNAERTVSSLIHGDNFSSLPYYYGENRTRGEWFIYEDELYLINGHLDTRHGTGATVSKYNHDLSGFVEDHLAPFASYSGKGPKVRVIDGVPVLMDRSIVTGGYGAPAIIAEYKGNGIWNTYPFRHDNFNELSNGRTVMKINGKPAVLYSSFNAIGSIFVATQSDYIGQKVWQKSKSNSVFEDPILAIGVALESGSKGDTIRIQKVKK